MLEIPQAPPPAPTAVTEMLDTPTGTVNEYDPAAVNVVVAVVAGTACATPAPKISTNGTTDSATTARNLMNICTVLNKIPGNGPVPMA